jgi:hypothetical protein
MTLNAFYTEDAVDDESYDENKKMLFNCYTDHYFSAVKGNRFVPLTLMINGNGDEKAEKKANGFKKMFEKFDDEATVRKVGLVCDMIDGAESMAEVMEIITEGLTDAAYIEVHKALRAAVNNPLAPAANRVISSTFEADKMFSLCTTVRNYARGGGAVIFAPPEFVGAMGPDAIVPVTAAGAQGIYHPQDIDRIHNQGYINLFRGTPIVQIPQSFVDTNNELTWIDPQLAYVLPTGGERVVKIVLEGNTQMYDWENKDQSLEMHVYKKMGAAIMTYYNFGIYQNTSIPQTMYSPYPNI